MKDNSEIKDSLIDKEIFKLILNSIDILSKKTEKIDYINNYIQKFLHYLLEIGETLKIAISENILRNV